MKEEIWKDVPNYEGLYQVSNLGNMKSFKKNMDGLILRSSSKNKGYQYTILSKDGKFENTSIHRLVLITFIGNSELQCNHKNGIKNDNRLENLEWVTRSENIKHAYTNKMRKSRNSIKKNTDTTITLSIHPDTYAKLKSISDEMRATGDPCTISNLVRKSIIKFLKESK